MVQGYHPSLRLAFEGVRPHAVAAITCRQIHREPYERGIAELEGTAILLTYYQEGERGAAPAPTASEAQIVARFRGVARESRSLGSPTAAELEEYDQAVEGVVRRVLQEDEGLHG